MNHYCDSAATMPILPEVWTELQKIHEHSVKKGINISSVHACGHHFHQIYEKRLEHFLSNIGATAREWFWTSGATESNTWALRIALLNRPECNHLVLHPLLHSSLLEPAMEHANQYGLRVSFLTLDSDYQISFHNEHIDHNTIVLLPIGDNEIGSLQKDWGVIEKMKNSGAWIHGDAAQSFGKIEMNFSKIPFDSVTISGHKMGALIGIGALYLRLRPQKKVVPIFRGGGQQFGFRSGTLPYHLIMAFLAAFEVWHSSDIRERLKYIGNRMRDTCKAHLITPVYSCLPHICTIYDPKWSTKQILELATKLTYSQGSACQKGKGSEALFKIGYDLNAQRRIIRLSLGLQNFEDIEQICQIVQDFLNIHPDHH